MFMFALVLLGVCACSQAWWKKPKTTPTTPSPKSRCVYYRERLRLHCYSTSGRFAACATKKPSVSSSTQRGGPPPRGEYLIGKIYQHMGRDWYNLYPKKRSSNAYWDYYYKSPDTGRSHIALHPGTVTLGCVTVTSNSCWNLIRDRVNTGSPQKQAVSASWGRKKTIDYVGRLKVV